jgi:hypothetical protein
VHECTEKEIITMRNQTLLRNVIVDTANFPNNDAMQEISSIVKKARGTRIDAPTFVGTDGTDWGKIRAVGISDDFKTSGADPKVLLVCDFGSPPDDGRVVKTSTALKLFRDHWKNNNTPPIADFDSDDVDNALDIISDLAGSDATSNNIEQIKSSIDDAIRSLNTYRANLGN